MGRLQLTKQHDPTAGCNDCHCYPHAVDETGNGYTRCFECGHLYRSKRELVWEWAKMHWLYGREAGASVLRLVRDILKKRADSIVFCLHCGHDF